MGRDGRPPAKVCFCSKNFDFVLFRLFLDLLDLKNGTGSKFYTGKWYSEVWKRKIKLFHDPGNPYLLGFFGGTFGPGESKFDSPGRGGEGPPLLITRMGYAMAMVMAMPMAIETYLVWTT